MPGPGRDSDPCMLEWFGVGFRPFGAMQKKRFPSHLVVGLMCLAAGGPAAAMGFGASTPAAALGQPLDFSVVLRVDAGETADPACVRAEVLQADRPLPAGDVVTRLERDGTGRPVIQVRTRVRIEEPIVTINLAAGCQDRMTRQFVVFADPPMQQARSLAAEVPPAVPAALLAQATPDSEPSAIAQTRTASAPAAVAGPRPIDASPQEAPRRPAPTIPAKASKPAAAAKPAPVDPPTPAQRPAAKPRASPPAAATASGGPRLRLDPAPPLDAAALAQQALAAADAGLTPEAMILVDRANEAVKAAIAAATASQQRIAALEASMRQMQAEAAARRESMQQALDRAAAAEARSRWWVPLMLAAAALLALLAWMWLRLRDLERDRRAAWVDVARHQPAAVPPPPSRVPLLVERSLRSGSGAALGAGLAPAHATDDSEWPQAAPVPGADALQRPSAPPPTERPVPAMEQTLPLVPQAAMAGPESRDVSAEELIDLEQQAEFFVVLGQDDAAIDLLVSHLRDTGGASPLPYLKLLEIYRRQGDRAAYERTRDRFNLRFNSRAPAWDAPPNAGRTLEDYPQVMHWLQRIWPQPMDAMAELEALLFRRDNGELFDLPAYRELLMLYAVAREEVDSRAGADTVSPVDVLLPLGMTTAGSAGTGPRRYFSPEARPDPRAASTSPVDLDLTDPEPGDTAANSRLGSL